MRRVERRPRRQEEEGKDGGALSSAERDPVCFFTHNPV